MLKQTTKGKLIAVDGPNGVGKTTIISEITKQLKNQGIDVLQTSEPTKTDLGKFIRSIQNTVKKETLACLVVADRYEHLSTEVIPALNEGKVVIMDRYILSSYILQGIDGLEFNFIDDINQNIILPDLQIALSASEEILCKRLNEREVKTRFEHDPSKELKYMAKGIKAIEEKGVRVEILDNTSNLMINVDKIIKLIENLK